MDFKNFGIHTAIVNGLEKSSYLTPTEVQGRIIPLARQGGNVVCSAKTGSGKTLAFLVPLLDRLLNMRWRRTDGLGALIIAPTRELALQIFEVIKLIGRDINLSGGLLIGGRSSEKEKVCVGALNIVVGTPGRILEHLSGSWGFSGDNLQMLVIDEADKLMEMGFKQTIEQILEYVSRKRQTLLFSATTDSIAQARKVWDIKSPEFVMITEKKEEVFLEQEAYSISPEKKFDLLYETIKKNLRRKSIVFLSTCKEVKFFHDLFKKLRFGLPLLYLNGNMSQNKRIETYHKFSVKEPKMLICTDIAARGLDFPDVDLVLQLDAPESHETYIHRMGRTARNGAKGKGIIALLEREKDLLADLQKINGFPEVKPFKGKRTISDRVRAAIREDKELYLLAQKYVKTYKGFIRVSKRKSSDEENALCIKEIAEYLGVKEDENVAWSGTQKRKSKLLNHRMTFDE
ncbi:ATP-dependent RNA helicase DDX10/DBP4 [Nematocida sp. LUAm3]|nr:ATP-dependent RNA helicase DDX10/DBP4 [Nematocida sp. LUAm3]KAI5173994.1 ATP-dependent RNA helicase DDX10/DBP4 [Nematocida sp. LUAm2]KAI5177262.1 ATP-dependent RNA helicase DDX10/DBP4 [Nematocida sp. LUAm1]